MKRFLSVTLLILLLLTILLIISCGGKKAGLQKRAVLPDKTLFANGMEFLRKHQFIKARLAFQTLINTYEDSEYLEKAKYYIAYSFLEEGGIENLVQAEQAFKDFKLFFPTSDLADDAQAHIVAINMRMMKAPNRDLTYTNKAYTEIKNFLEEFPDSPLVEEMKLRLHYVEDILATSSYLKGKFYYKKKFYKASASRFRECVTRFKTFGLRDSALYMLADSLEHLKNTDESAIYYAQLVRGYPFSQYFKTAKERLQKLEKPIPPVDKKLAEENQKYYTQEGSMLLAPFRMIFSIFSFGGQDKPWEALEKKREKQEKELIKSYAKKENKKKKRKA